MLTGFKLQRREWEETFCPSAAQRKAVEKRKRQRAARADEELVDFWQATTHHHSSLITTHHSSPLITHHHSSPINRPSLITLSLVGFWQAADDHDDSTERAAGPSTDAGTSAERRRSGSRRPSKERLATFDYEPAKTSRGRQ